ncbi:hypothetical protein DEO72_LG8g1896 [Vigna unguiculata]|uniref:Uncharacterized protein n=1 Tax=Vigna unguiculata TaxID=3917 RepID=A0A4D6MVD9_VIGUN|nr:hypothetical protein DEO72_LG8g1896 [Vigna unguiculata]
MNPNPTGKTPKKMDSNRKMETQKIPQCADEGGTAVVLVGGGAMPAAGGEGGHGGGPAMVSHGTKQWWRNDMKAQAALIFEGRGCI